MNPLTTYKHHKQPQSHKHTPKSYLEFQIPKTLTMASKTTNHASKVLSHTNYEIKHAKDSYLNQTQLELLPIPAPDLFALDYPN